ncbi:hypothetical protein [Sphingomicrobium aestuariivivum]|uniref:hypothetical protein n=1 Tax=Sphingomicrobium aestuariivivum TaxID=1582356 RepID=UPI001FD70284|nr:hypothetical protein [Sphingomicrobium aestuariivivum]MCJ8190250.1 hypothetical protein [Sphingomicrobium aestuariivivum]
MIVRAALVLALAALTACGDKGARDMAEEEAGSRMPAPAGNQPHLILYKSAEEGGPEAFMEALIGGSLLLDGPCVAVDVGGGPVTIVTTEGSLHEDGDGLFLRVGPHEFRHGDPIMSGGGALNGLPADGMLTAPVPEACREGPAVEMSYLYPAPPGGPGQPPESPPPPDLT